MKVGSADGMRAKVLGVDSMWAVSCKKVTALLR